MLTLNKNTRPDSDRIIRLPELIATTGVSASTVLRWERTVLFPSRIRIGPRSVGWRVSEVARWIASRDAAIGEDTPPVPGMVARELGEGYER